MLYLVLVIYAVELIGITPYEGGIKTTSLAHFIKISKLQCKGK